ncbi:anti-anti-sigma regulatory factor, SpoIIAA [Micromonospora rhizosphaerae]|uniref:Anti-sigma factor antagonist n=1 Tax=Micromonospora rhizosphaerae TaxID=568872 RepID=A0A1C6RLR7_9ACTN|nr:STAS domain-containing protein [Micromonospora rhizosphaerae]SCL18100.1 anti-anti-sigma regulatory factor, SpoIIAA [Micromonospora rhizosphaerae]
MGNLTISTSVLADGTTVVALRGEIDVSVCDALLSALVDEVTRRRPPRLVVDMLHVTFLDSTGLNTLLAAYRDARRLGISFVVRHPSEFVARQMRVAGTYDILTSD